MIIKRIKHGMNDFSAHRFGGAAYIVRDGFQRGVSNTRLERRAAKRATKFPDRKPKTRCGFESVGEG